MYYMLSMIYTRGITIYIKQRRNVQMCCCYGGGMMPEWHRILEYHQ